jgi:hypothetical protein
MNPSQLFGFAAALLCTSHALVAGEKNFKQPAPEPDKWQLRLSLPAWIAGVEGTTGLHGVSSHTAQGFGEIVPHVDMAASFRAELRKGRFGVYVDFLYMSLSDGIAGDGIIKKISGRQDEYLGDLGLAWRLCESERGYVDLIGGVRYTNLYEELELQTNDQRVEQVSERLAVAGAVARAVLAREARELSDSPKSIANAPLAGADRKRLAAAIERIRNNTAARKERIERTIHHKLDRRFSRSDDWFDPYIGLRGRYNLNEKYYLLARADIGGFGVGSDLSWSASGGVGCQLSPRVYTEITYRALGMDYDHDGFIYDMVTHGPELSLGITF